MINNFIFTILRKQFVRCAGRGQKFNLILTWVRGYFSRKLINFVPRKSERIIHTN